MNYCLCQTLGDSCRRLFPLTFLHSPEMDSEPRLFYGSGMLMRADYPVFTEKPVTIQQPLELPYIYFQVWGFFFFIFSILLYSCMPAGSRMPCQSAGNTLLPQPNASRAAETEKRLSSAQCRRLWRFRARNNISIPLSTGRQGPRGTSRDSHPQLLLHPLGL